jgi:hypothetical protein
VLLNISARTTASSAGALNYHAIGETVWGATSSNVSTTAGVCCGKAFTQWGYQQINDLRADS